MSGGVGPTELVDPGREGEGCQYAERTTQLLADERPEQSLRRIEREETEGACREERCQRKPRIRADGRAGRTGEEAANRIKS